MIGHPAYSNDETMDLHTWAARHRGIKNDMGKAFGVFQDYPDVPVSVKSYHSGVKDLRAAVDKYVPGGKKGDPFELNLMHMKITDIVVKAWRKYQNYLRSRNDFGAIERHAAEMEEWKARQAAKALAQPQPDA